MIWVYLSGTLDRYLFRVSKHQQVTIPRFESRRRSVSINPERNYSASSSNKKVIAQIAAEMRQIKAKNVILQV